MRKFLLMVVGTLLSLPAMAQDTFFYEYEGQTLEYTVDSKADWWSPGSVTINKQAESSINGELVIPELVTNTVDGNTLEYQVSVINEKAFFGQTGLTSITIPSSVYAIEDNILDGCDNLRDVIIADGDDYLTLYYNCFENTTFKNLYLGRPYGVCGGGWVNPGCYPISLSGVLESVEIGEKVSEIAASAFAELYNLKSVKINAPLTTIPNRAFYRCTHLESLNVPETVTYIGDRAFDECYDLHIELPSGVEHVGEGALKNTRIPYLIFRNNVTIGKEAFRDCHDLFSVLLNGKENDINNELYARPFYNCTRLFKVAAREDYGGNFYGNQVNSWTIEDNESIDLENGVIISADKSQIWVSNKYQGEITLPDAVTRLDSWSIANCTGITKVVLPLSLTTVTDAAFAFCSSIRELIFPQKVNKLEGEDIFYETNSLKKIAYPSGIDYPFETQQFAAVPYDVYDATIEDNSFIFSRRKDKLYYASVNVTPAYVVPETVTEITDLAFAACDNLKSVTLPEKLSKLGDRVWDGCNAIEKVICKNAEPVVADNDLFTMDTYFNATLYVPKGSKSKYESTAPWKNFYDISEDATGAIDDIVAEEGNAPVEIFNLNGVRVTDSIDNLPAGIYISRQGNKVEKISVK